MVGDGGGCEGCWEGVWRAFGGRWEGVGRALGGRWEGVGLASGEGQPGSLIYRQIKSLHCSGYLLVLYISGNNVAHVKSARSTVSLTLYIFWTNMQS